MEDFVDIMVPVLEAGTWTNLGHTPPIVTLGKSGPGDRSRRSNKNERVEVKNAEGSSTIPEYTFDGTLILNTLRGEISPISTDKSDRNKMKKDVIAITKAAGLPFTTPSINDNPSLRNRDKATFLMEIIDC